MNHGSFDKDKKESGKEDAIPSRNRFLPGNQFPRRNGFPRFLLRQGHWINESKMSNDHQNATLFTYDTTCEIVSIIITHLDMGKTLKRNRFLARNRFLWRNRFLERNQFHLWVIPFIKGTDSSRNLKNTQRNRNHNSSESDSSQHYSGSGRNLSKLRANFPAGRYSTQVNTRLRDPASWLPLPVGPSSRPFTF